MKAIGRGSPTEAGVYRAGSPQACAAANRGDSLSWRRRRPASKAAALGRWIEASHGEANGGPTA
eukprot:CAMPEP_0179200172 /NCGR_PEP_ID=MMETSP0796-20121207/99610_1 /TAXON_ID=73915 /ORGANISM="Pyrodinium bahamense, Strain pbaha01" /LENGTH=63 /DNA_ID=CAMNT_0020904709 /DNA_START=34 /DNA_END=222 /DNA_ORIENTATION=-